MAGPESRWGNDRSRLRIVSIVMFVLLAALLALGWVMSRSRAAKTGIGYGTGGGSGRFHVAAVQGAGPGRR